MKHLTRIDSREEIKKLDKSNVLGSIEALPDQIQDAWTKASQIKLPADYSQVNNVVVMGMGGSALSTHIIKHLYKKDLQLPLEVYNHYEIPGYVNQDSLVILFSYSGNTEEVLEAAVEASLKTKKILVITSGGKLKAFAQRQNFPIYLIDPIYNPSNQPRMAIGYTVFGQLALFKTLGFINLETSQVEKLVQRLKDTAFKLAPEDKENNTAKYLAYAAFQKIIVLVSAEHLRGAAHVFNNQLNENAKNLTIELALPEMNHHYMEALPFPKQTKENVIFFFFQSKLYHPRVQVRVPLTNQVAEQEGYPTEIISATAPTKLEQVFEIIQLGAYTNFYLAMLHGIDPAPIPKVDFFKAQLAKFN